MQKKKALISLLISMVLLTAVFIPTAAETAGSVKIMVNNSIFSSSTEPEYINGTILVPAKEYVEALGGTFAYDSKAMAGTVKLGENELVFRLDSSVAKLNGKYIQAPAPMKVIDFRFMIPAEFTAQKLGGETYVNAARNTLMVFNTGDGKIVYQVMAGDSLWSISQIFGVSISTIKQQNGLTVDSIYIGQKLIIKYSGAFSVINAAQTIGNATLRSGPGTGFAALTYLTAWVDISVVGKIDAWYKVITPKGNGYIYYTVVGVKQDMSDTAPDSSYFNNRIPFDTSKDYVTYITYTVQKGDTLWAISEKFGIPDYELAAANNITTSTTLYISQVLKVPVHNIPVKSTPGFEYGEILDWFKEAQYTFPIGKVGRFIDIATGKSFMAKRTMGANHSDTETLTIQDTQAMKEIFGGSWNWNRRAFILEVDGRRFAVSVAGMPHAGIDGVPYLQNVSGRSDNWGYGPNYDRISGNGMDGHFDVYFLNCLRHKDNAIDSGHQYNVMVAGGLR